MDQAARIREKIDLVTLISEYIPLKKMGRNFKTNCPFHNEKSPSFVVSPERQIWHCFGCGKGGDCFTFLMEYENLEFIEALKTLGKRAGIEVELSATDKGISSQKERIYKINRQAAQFYHYILTKHAVGKRALEYLTKRKISEKVIETFQLGFAPSTSNSLSNYLMQKKGHKSQDLVDAGLSSLRNGRVMDFFFNRIMFPLFDHRDNIIGFSGRTLDESSTSSKYVNTRETLVYHKGDVFFGLNSAKDEIKKEQTAIIMEGEFDVISAFMEGVGNAIAVKGTSLTENQVQLISRFAQKILLCFDNDSAGFEAMKRSLKTIEKKGITPYVVVLQNGKDPDEAIKDNPALFKKSIHDHINAYDFLISKIISQSDKKTVEGKKKISDELFPLIGGIENEIVKEHYLKKLADELDTSLESITRQLEKNQKGETPIVQVQNNLAKRSKEEASEHYLLSIIVQSKDAKALYTEAEEILKGFTFTISSYDKLFKELGMYFTKNDNFEASEFVKRLPNELHPSFDACYLFPLPKFEDEKRIHEDVKKAAKTLKEIYVKEKIKKISDAIRLKEKETHKDKEVQLEKLKEEFSQLVSFLK